MYRAALFSLALLFGALLTPDSASAFVNVYVPTPGTSMIGMYEGWIYLTTAPANGGACIETVIAYDRLRDLTKINGTSGADAIQVAVGSTYFCGKWYEPIRYDGRILQVFGLDGNDSINLGNGAANQGMGNNGNDRLYTAFFNDSRVRGGDGDDTLYANGSAAVHVMLYGENHSDQLCAKPYIPAWMMHGGANHDRSCGPSHDYLEIEEPNSCSRCGAGYR
jgi:hypothetical protein